MDIKSFIKTYWFYLVGVAICALFCFVSIEIALFTGLLVSVGVAYDALCRTEQLGKELKETRETISSSIQTVQHSQQALINVLNVVLQGLNDAKTASEGFANTNSQLLAEMIKIIDDNPLRGILPSDKVEIEFGRLLGYVRVKNGEESTTFSKLLKHSSDSEEITRMKFMLHQLFTYIYYGQIKSSERTDGENTKQNIAGTAGNDSAGGIGTDKIQ